MNYPGRVVIFASLLPLGLGGCQSRSSSFVDAMSAYRGEGAIEDTTVRSLYIVAPGFRITLPPMMPAPNREYVFHLNNLPTTRHKELGLCLQLEPRIDLRAHASKVALSLELRDANGSTIYQHSGISATHAEKVRYSKYWDDHTWVFGAPYCPYLGGESYTLHVRYSTTDPAFAPELVLIAWSGGFL